MVVFLDTNILVDYFDRRELFQEAEEVFNFCCSNGNRGIIASLSFSNFFYLLRKTETAQERKEDIRHMSQLFIVGAVDSQTVETALNLDMDDYEDAIQAACAEQYKAQVIVTNNVRDFVHSPVRAMTAKDFVSVYVRGERL